MGNDKTYAPWVDKYGLRHPYGLCQCGCGQATRLSNKDDAEWGYKRDHPRPFLLGHKPSKHKPNDMAPWVQMYGLKHNYGKCQCGCGKDAPLAKSTRKHYGTIKGKPQRFCLGHVNFGQHHYKYRTLREAFEKQVHIGKRDACWLARTTDGNGYGLISFWGKQHYAHRVAYELFVGPIPEGHLVRHQCDNRPCANPSHLLTGTDQDNSNDKVKRGRQARGHGLRGEKHPNYKHGKYVNQPRRKERKRYA